MEKIIISTLLAAALVIIFVYIVKKTIKYFSKEERKHARKIKKYLSSCFQLADKGKYHYSIFISFSETKKFSANLFNSIGFNESNSNLKVQGFDFWHTKDIRILNCCLDSYDELFHIGWKTIIEKLYRKRRRRPINGILIPISISKIIKGKAGDETFTSTYIKCCKQIEEKFKQKIPVIIIPTGINNIKNFHSFYSCLDREERTTPLSLFNFNTKNDASFDLSWNDFINNLFLNGIDRLNSMDADNSRRTIYFLSQMTLLGSHIGFYLSHLENHLLNKNLYHSGLFFLPENEKKTNYDLVSSYCSQELSAEKIETGKGGEFISPILSVDIISNILTSIGCNASYNTFNNKIYNITRYTLLTCGFLSFLCVSIWYVFLSEDEIDLANISNHKLQHFYRQAEHYDTDKYDINSAINNIYILKNVTNIYDEYNENLPIRKYFHRKTLLELNKFYEKYLVDILTPYIVTVLEKELEASITNADVNKVVSNLLYHHSFFSEQDNKQQVEIKDDILNHLSNTYFLEEKNKDRFHIILNDYMATNKKLAKTSNLELINKSNVFLQTKSNDAIYYELLKNRLSSMRYDVVTSVFGKSFNNANFPFSCNQLSLDCYNKSVIFEIKKLIDKGILKNDIEEIIKLKNDFNLNDDFSDDLIFSTYQLTLDKYMDDYVAKWRMLIKCMNINTVKNLADLKRGLAYFLTIEDNPIISIARAIQSNTKITGLDCPSEKKVFDLNSKMSNYLCVKTQELENEFSNLYSFLEEKKEGSLLVKLNSNIEDVYLRINNVEESEQQAYRASLELHEYIKGSHPINSIQSLAHHNTNFINAWINKLVSNWVRVFSTITSQYINKQWVKAVAIDFKENIAPYFPFNNSEVDVDMNDFIRYFSPNGLFDDFQKKKIKPVLGMNTLGWNPIHITNEYMQFMKWSSKISESCFNEKKSINISFKVNYMSSDFTGFSLNNGLSNIWYDHGPSIWQKMKFQGSAFPGDDIFLNFYHNDKIVKSHRFSGSWSLIKLLQKSKIDFDENQNIITASYNNDAINFQIKADMFTQCMYQLSSLKTPPITNVISKPDLRHLFLTPR